MVNCFVLIKDVCSIGFLDIVEKEEEIKGWLIF